MYSTLAKNVLVKLLLKQNCTVRTFACTVLCSALHTLTGTASNPLDGNNSYQFLTSLGKLLTAKLGGTEAPEDSELLLPASAQPIVDTLAALLKVVDGTMGHGLVPNYSELIEEYTR